MLRYFAISPRASLLLQTLRGHEHVVETLCYGKKPTDAAAIMAAAAAAAASGENGTAAAADANSKDTQVCNQCLCAVFFRVLLGFISQAEFSYLASGSRDRSVKLWDPLQGVCLMTFTAHENWVRSVLFHPSFKYLLSCSDDKSIRVLDIKVSPIPADRPLLC